jgi:hypothetical protein
MANQMVAKSVTQTRRPQRRSAIRILEEAVHLLRRAPGHLFAYYYTGTLPFILGLLYFWGDMSHNAYATEYSAVASLGMALLFVWMKSWQAIFASRIRVIIVNQPAYRLSWFRIFNLVANQALIHASGFLVLPLAALVMLPFGWCYAFYQNATVKPVSKIVAAGQNVAQSKSHTFRRIFGFWHHRIFKSGDHSVSITLSAKKNFWLRVHIYNEWHKQPEHDFSGYYHRINLSMYGSGGKDGLYFTLLLWGGAKIRGRY